MFVDSLDYKDFHISIFEDIDYIGAFYCQIYSAKDKGNIQNLDVCLDDFCIYEEQLAEKSLQECIKEYIDVNFLNEYIYRIVDTNEKVSEKYLRKMLFNFEVEDIMNNKDEYFEEMYDLNVQMENLHLAMNGDMEKVIYRLETYWNVPVDKESE